MANLRFYLDPLGRPRELIRATLAERTTGYRFWPQHGVEIDGSIYLSYIGIRHYNPSVTWGFEPVGAGIARLNARTGDCQRLMRNGEWRILISAPVGLHFGVQFIRDGDWVYAFSSRQTGPFSAAILSRVPAVDFVNPDAWTHLIGPEPRWSDGLENACDLALCGMEFSVSWNALLRQYLMTYVDGYAKTLQLRTAPSLWGPYSEAVSVGSLPHRPESEIISLGFEHPMFATEDGNTIYISYCQPRFTQNSLVVIGLQVPQS